MSKEIFNHIKKKTVTREEISKAVGISTFDTERLYEKIEQLIERKILSPRISSGTNGNPKYLIYNKYDIIKPDNEPILEEIRKLHPRLSKSPYLFNHPEEYQRNKRYFLQLSQYLYRGVSDTPLSKYERAYEIFGEEKALDEIKGFSHALAQLHINSEVLNYYDTHEWCFYDYYADRNKTSDLTIVVCENKDIWFNIRRYMHESGQSSLLGQKIDGTIYGSGNKAASANSLTNYLNFARITNPTLLYWGDIDLAGIHIMRKIISANPNLNIIPFTEAYEYMMALAKERGFCIETIDQMEKCHNSKDTLQQEDISALNPTSKENKELLHEILKRDVRIPQEIVTFSKLRS